MTLLSRWKDMVMARGRARAHATIQLPMPHRTTGRPSSDEQPTDSEADSSEADVESLLSRWRDMIQERDRDHIPIQEPVPHQTGPSLDGQLMELLNVPAPVPSYIHPPGAIDGRPDQPGALAQGPVDLPMPLDSTVVQPSKFEQVATMDQQRKLMRYMNDWLARDVQDHQADSQAVAARVDQLRKDLGRLGIGAGTGGPQPPAILVPGIDRSPSAHSPVIPEAPAGWGMPDPSQYVGSSRSSTPSQESYHPPHSPSALPVPLDDVPNAIPVQPSLQGVPTGPIVTHPSTSATMTLEQGSIPVSDERFPNDLTNQVIRDGRDPVASGGFADIYRGILQESGESIKVAIKSIKTYSGEDRYFSKKQKRLRREIKVWLNLRHVNVLPLLGTTMGFGRFPAMVCPWAENGPLTSYLEDHHDSLSVIEILGLLNDVTSGLQYLHSRSVVHGDLSGSNVLIRENGRAYISDFGLSMLLTELGGSTFATSFHARGTLRWTAPELLDLEVPEDDMEEESPRVAPTTQSDVYSFGCIMLQILSGRVPYHYYTREAQVVHAVSRGMKPRRPSSVLVTERRWAFILRCWSTVDVARSRPSSEEIVAFTEGELVGTGTS